ncbi:NUDIX hydrolase [Bacillus sp. Marseille-P3661]|uniref:NUDIX hydrolase n=1 Tax=Bacillus sp. Marseille-P3661 TaxID=1936234 RepID=UPI000C86387A|nr:NUDIX hydrolase [Bacillus sp. Marseille-P3661]
MGYIEEIRQKVGQLPLILNSSGIIIKNDNNEILLQYRKDTHNWGLPGGYMEPGETYEETIIRELKEEMGIKVGTLSLLKIFSGREFFHKYPNGDQVYSVMAIYVANEIIGELKADQNEISEIKFFSLDALPKEMTATTQEILGFYINHKNDEGIFH